MFFAGFKLTNFDTFKMCVLGIYLNTFLSFLGDHPITEPDDEALAVQHVEQAWDKAKHGPHGFQHVVTPEAQHLKSDVELALNTFEVLPEWF